MATAAAVLALTVARSQAQSADQMFMSVDAGPAFQSNIGIKDGTGFIGPGGNIDFDTGVRANVDLGWQLDRSCSLALETGLIWNNINQVGVQPLSSVSASGELYEVPILVKGDYTFRTRCRFKPYIGVGLGSMVGIFQTSHIPGSGAGPSPNFSDTDFTFAYQAELGFKYAVCKHCSAGLAYQFVGTSAHQWSDNGLTLKTDGTLTHAIVATVTWKF